MRPISSLWLAAVLSAWAFTAGAQAQEPVNPPPATTTTSSTPVTTRGGAGSTAETRIVSSFSGWAGSEDNARSLVTGLRQGGEITLTASTPAPSGSGGTGAPGAGGAGTTTTNGTTFTPPTRPMGYGNVRIALSLAREQLAQSGVTQPTPAQIEAALMGPTPSPGTGGATATNTQFPGVLQMRADGMGWGQIANSMGVKLGHVMSGRTSVPPPAATPTGTAQTGSGTGASTGSGITTASGATSSTATTQSPGKSALAHQRGAGIVTASGNSAAGVSAGARGHGGGASAGIVTGAGTAAGSNGSGAVRAQGKGHVNP